MAGTTQEELAQFLQEHGLDAPSLDAIDAAYDELAAYLHAGILQSDQASPILPMILCEKVGTFRMGVPTRNDTLKVAIFGTISTDIYHDLIWEQIQKIPEYRKSDAGIYKVRKLPDLTFSIHYKGLNFEWTYYRSSRKDLTLFKEFLSSERADQVDIENSWANEDERQLIIDLGEQSDLRSELASTKHAYYEARAWASLNGCLDESMLIDIIKFFTVWDDHIVPGSTPGLYKLLNDADAIALKDIDSAKWLSLLQNSIEKSLADRFGADRYFMIKVMHTGCSNTRATAWFEYIEERLPTLQDIFKRTLLTTPKEDPRQKKQEVLHRSSKWSPYRCFWPDMSTYMGRFTHESKESMDPSYYEGSYMFGLRNAAGRFLASSEEVRAATERWLATIRRHEFTIPGKCFIDYEILTSDELSKLELQNGTLTRCLRPATHVFLPAPIAISTPQETESSTAAPSNVPASSQEQSQSQPTQQTTTKLRTASDIHNRLLHDSSFNIDEFVIGYIDRFSPEPLEMRAADWERVKEHEAFIPESRIRYFKRRWRDGGAVKEEVVWDRGRRIDAVFGSGNSSGERGG